MITNDLKERPILFSGEMVRAILDGRKTQTRRVVKPQDVDLATDVEQVADFWRFSYQDGNGIAWTDKDCPHGKPGDRLWVRETWAVHGILYDDLPPSGIHCSVKGGCWEPGDSIWYQADKSGDPATGKCSPHQRGKWRPSIHMPRWASRLTLEVTEVRVERLQDITPEDASTEGVDFDEVANQWGKHSPGGPMEASVAAFKVLWDSINCSKHPWSSNPWVWVVSFKKLEPSL